MNDVIKEVAGTGDYDSLPTAIKALYSPREYAWLADADKARLVTVETEPETD